MGIVYYLQLKTANFENSVKMMGALVNVQGVGLTDAKQTIEYMMEKGIKDILRPDKTRWEFATRSEAEEKRDAWNERMSENTDVQVNVRQGQAEEEAQMLESLEEIGTAKIFPRIYEGFRETTELAKAEDGIAEILKQCVKTLLNDRNIETASERKISEWEEATEIEPEGTIEERREAIRDALMGNRAFNEGALKALVDKKAGEGVLGINIDYVNQEIGIYKTGNSEQETGDDDMQVELATRVAHEILAEIPQALRCYGETQREESKTIILNHGKTTTVYAKGEGGGMETGVVIDLNKEWATVDPEAQDLDTYDEVATRKLPKGSGYTIIKSVSNKGVPNSTAIAYIKANYSQEKVMQCYTMNCAEGNTWDFLEIKLDGQEYGRINSAYNGNMSIYALGIPAGIHTFTLTFKKDGTVDKFGDCAYFAVKNAEIEEIRNGEQSTEPEPEPVYTPKYIRLSFGTARNDVTINGNAKSSVALKFYYGGTQYGDIGKYLTGEGAPLNFNVAKAITKAGANVDTTNLVVHGTSDADLNLYVYNNGSSAVTLATIWIEIPRYTYAVHGQGGNLESKRNLIADGYLNLLGANPTWNYTWLPNELYKLMGATDDSFDCEFRNSDGTYSARSDLNIMIGTSYMNIHNITDHMIYDVPTCRFETWLPEMYEMADGNMVLIGASALSLEEE